MAFKTFAPGVLTSSDVNTFLMRQSVIVCTSTTRPGSPNEGMTIYETDTDLTRQYSGSAWEVVAHIGAWQTYSPTVVTGGAGTAWTIGNGTITGHYQQVGRAVIVRGEITFGSTSTFGTQFLALTLPIAAAATTTINVPGGLARFQDDSTADPWLGFTAYFATAMRFHAIDSSAAYTKVSTVVNNVPFTWAQSDQIGWTFTYEAAS
jgi:hypothetical protein